MYTGKSIKKVQKGCTYIVASTKEELKEGSKIPVPADGDQYVTEDYKYTYFQKFEEGYLCEEVRELKLSGWELRVRIEGNPKEEYEEVLGKIGNEQVIAVRFNHAWGMKKSPKLPEGIVSMHGAFATCANLEEPPKIPDSVIDMSFAFERCKSLKTAPEIPEGVVNLERTFWKCENLMIAPELPESVKNMNSTFYGCKNLTTVRRIPSNVIWMNLTFYGCTSLTGEIIVDANPKTYHSCFWGGVDLENITLIGDSNLVEEYD
ncbi:MAG: leucine-rich repeat protein [Lachnospiraceae bacterium]|nr:leucine-rich repeat protein [Lachnospiraceae bacterium]